MARRRHSRRNRLEIDVLSYAELEYYVTGDHAALILIVEPERSPTVPAGFGRQLRLRIGTEEARGATVKARRSLLRTAGYALTFTRRLGPLYTRLAVCSPEGEGRAPALAAGLLAARRSPSDRIAALEARHPRLSEPLRRATLEVAGVQPPTRMGKASRSPLVKAAMVLLAKITDSFS